jgi:REP element-mobilizing transposase RayT
LNHLNLNELMNAPLFYRRRLPHWQPPGADVFLTYRLYGSLPKNSLRELADWFALLQKRGRKVIERSFPEAAFCEQDQQLLWQYILRLDEYLDEGLNGPFWLREPALAELIIESWQFTEHSFGTRVHAVCVMPNHVHAVVRLPASGLSLREIMQRHKGYTASRANQWLGRNGPFWQEETFDRVIRPGMLAARVAYTLDNPVKARLVKHPAQWPGIYCSEEWRGLLE